MSISLKDYASRNPVNERIAENMVDVDMLQGGMGSFEARCYLVFQKAYEIVRDMIQNPPASIWKIPDYFKTAAMGAVDDELYKGMAGAAFSVVLILSEHIDEAWRIKNQKFLDKMNDYLRHIYLPGETVNISGHENVTPLGAGTKCMTAYQTLRRGTDIDYLIPLDEFLYPITHQTATPSSEEKYVTREELERILKDKINAATERYQEESVITKKEVLESWNKSLDRAGTMYSIEVPHFEYDEQKETLYIIQGTEKKTIEQDQALEGKVREIFKKIIDEESATEEDIDEMFPDDCGKDSVGQEKIGLKGTDNVYETDDAEKEVLKAENDELKKQISQPNTMSKEEDLETLKKELERYKTLCEVAEQQKKRLEEEIKPGDELDWREQLQIKERIIFFQALTGCSLKGNKDDKKCGTQTQKAKFIARFSGNDWKKIRSIINEMNSEIEDVENKKRDKFSQGVSDAALNVYNFLHKAVEGNTVGSKPHRCKVAMQDIDRIYHLNIDRAMPPPKGNDFIIEREQQDVE